MSRIKKISGANLARNWVMIPHVTVNEDADVTELEQFRVQMNKELEKSGVKVSMLPFMMKAAVATLKKFPEFNASLDGDALVLKNYLPFTLLIVVFVLGFLGLAYSLYPYVVIDRLTIWQAASSPAALKVILIGVSISLPAIAAYTAFSYRVFRGKATDLRYA